MANSKPTPESHAAAHDTDRAVTNTIGYAILFGFLVITAAALVGSGLPSTAAVIQDETGQAAAKQSASQFAADASAVAHGSASTRTVDFAPGSDGTRRVDPDAGSFKLILENSTGEQTVFNATLGKFTYETGGTTTVYQGGGIWQQTQGSTQIISNPTVYYRDTSTSQETLTVSLVTINGTEGRTTDAVTLNSPPTNTENAFTVGGNQSTLAETEARIEVTSDLAKGWENYFKTNTPANVSRSGDTVTAKIRTQSAPIPAENALTVTGSEGVTFGEGGTFTTSSYNPNGPDEGTNGDIYANGDLVIGEDVKRVAAAGTVAARDIVIDEESGATIDILSQRTHNEPIDYTSPDAEIQTIRNDVDDKNLESDPNADYYGNGISFEQEGSTKRISGSAYIDGDISVEEGATLIIEPEDRFAVNEDVTVQADDIDIEEGGEIKVNPGLYGSNVMLAAEEFEAEGSSGLDIGSSVGGSAQILFTETDIEENSYMTVSGTDTQAQFYFEDEFEAEGNVDITAANGQASNLWMYAGGEMEMESEGQTELTGVLYAPTSEFEIEGDFTVNGALVAESLEAEEGDIRFNYDESIGRSSQPLSEREEAASAAVYVHVSEEEINVS